MLGPQSADREPGDSSRGDQRRAGMDPVPVGLRQRDLYAPLFLEFANFDTRTRSILEAKLPDCSWQIITEYLLPCMQRGETFEANRILQYATEFELPMISQTQRFFLTPSGGGVEVENRIVVTGGSDPAGVVHTPSIQIMKSGIDDGAFSARVEFSSQERTERWEIVDSIMSSFSNVAPSEQTLESSQKTFRVSLVAPGISLGLFPVAPNSPELPSNDRAEKRVQPAMWVPQDITVREPSYGDHRVMASHAFPERAQEIVTSGILPHLEAFVEREKGLSRDRLARISKKLESPVRISVWRWYSPTRMGSEGFDVGSGSGIPYAPGERSMANQILSMSELLDPTEAVNPRSISFVGASAQSDGQEERSRTRGRLRLEYQSPTYIPEGDTDATQKHFNARWRDLLTLMRDLNLSATKKELLGLLRELQERAGKDGERVSPIRLTIQDPYDPEGQRAISSRFVLTKVS